MNSQITNIVYTSQSKCLKVAILLLFPIGAICSPAFIILAGLIQPPVIIKFLFLSLSFIGLASVAPSWMSYLYCAFVRHAAVSLSLDGIWILRAGLIRWREISSISIDCDGNKRWLFIIPHDPQLIWDRMPIFKKLYSKINSIFVPSSFMIPEHLIEGSLDELVAKIQDYNETNIKPNLNKTLNTQDKHNLTLCNDSALIKMKCPKCQNENVSRPINKAILLFSIVIFVVADIFYSIWGHIESKVFYLVIIINAVLTAGFSIYFRKYKCRNCGFKWK